MSSVDDAVKLVGLAVRQMGAQSVLSSVAMAKRFGLHTTDLEVLDLIFLREEVSAGELAKATGLTTGSVTALVDRLLARDFVTRHEDPKDRRRTLVRINKKAVAPIAKAYIPRHQAMFELWSEYDPGQLELIKQFLERSTELLAKLTDEEQRAATPLKRATGM
jgi:DNA-binding MarR family transcriptional regulator